MNKLEYDFETLVRQFEMEGHLKEVTAYGSGHINDTFLGTVEHKDNEIKRYIIQRMNTQIFKDPDALIKNIVGVTTHLRSKIIENGGDPERETLNLVPTKEGAYFYVDGDGNYFRIYLFIEDSTSFDAVEKTDDFFQSALSFGHFQGLLSDYPAETLSETIKDFHNTPIRFETFRKAVEKDVMGRAASVQKEIQFILEREDFTHILLDLHEKGELPLRVTHNDTKLNNIMIDNKTGKGICVIDLDTVMPGFAVNDFGDSIRFGANTASEDETDLSKVSLDLTLYDLYTKGFIEGCEGNLNNTELSMLPYGAKMMTLECGMRFLTDYLEGDHYFKIHRENHNLDRTRTQLGLVLDMEKHWEEMEAVVRKYSCVR